MLSPFIIGDAIDFLYYVTKIVGKLTLEFSYVIYLSIYYDPFEAVPIGIGLAGRVFDSHAG